MDNSQESLEDYMPPNGFIKTTDSRMKGLSAEQRTHLIRKGNEFFNNGNIEQAKRIFLTTGYSDGLIRVGDYCLEQNDPFEALRLYKIAPAPKKAEAVIEKMATTIRHWMGETPMNSSLVN